MEIATQMNTRLDFKSNSEVKGAWIQQSFPLFEIEAEQEQELKSKKYKTINDAYTEFIYKRTYSRWDWDKQRRETWEETVDRYFNFFEDLIPANKKSAYEIVKKSVLNKKVVPSMRALWSAGEALKQDNVAAYNCAYTTVNRPEVFSEIMYILMNGAGCGFSVERQYINELPEVPIYEDAIEGATPELVVFEDSKIGWSEGYKQFVNHLYNGDIPEWDLSQIRPEGSILKTFGGRASGPEPLKRLLEFTVQTFKNAQGRKLNSIECHDLVCYVGSIVVVGGVRRSATISLSNLSDDRMKHAKDGAGWFQTHPHRTLANNSTAYTEKPDMKIFMQEWLSLAYSGSGERGIFNRVAANKVVKRNGRRQKNKDFGCNPCCIVPETLITTDKGEIPLIDIIENGIEKYKILTYNVDTQMLEWENIEFADKTRENATIVEIELEDGTTIDLTPDHKVYTENRGWIEAGILTENDIVISIE